MIKIILIIIFCQYSYAEEAGHTHESNNKSKESESIELSAEATKNFGIKIQKISSKSQKAEIPIAAIVDSEDKKQIFIFHDGKYEIKVVNIVKRTPASVIVDSFPESEDVVVSGANFLKVVEMSHGEEGAGGHGH